MYRDIRTHRYIKYKQVQMSSEKDTERKPLREQGIPMWQAIEDIVSEVAKTNKRIKELEAQNNSLIKQNNGGKV